MDLALFGRVLWRFRMIVLAGLVLAFLLATLSFVRVGADGVSYREKEQWVSYSTLFVTQRGFTWGSLVGEPGGQSPKTRAATGANPTRLSSLAILYAQLATTDPVMRRLAATTNQPHIEAAPVETAQGSGDALPFVRIAAFGDSPAASVKLAKAASRALETYVRDEQIANGINPNDRVALEIVNRPRSATLFAGRSKTLPIVIFLTIGVAVVGLAFILENLRPRVRVVPAEQHSRTISGAA